MSKRALVVRYGAYGDMIGITHVLKRLNELGYYIILNTTERGREPLEHCPWINEWKMHDSSMPVDKLSDHWDKLKSEVPHDLFINFSESIECNVALHPINPEYIYPKRERYARCNKNYYDVTSEWAKVDGCQKLPELHFIQEEEDKARSYIKEGKFNILWAMSGSGKQKVYPWTDYVIGEVLKNFPDVHFITVGDLRSQLLETVQDENITHLSGEVPIRISMALTKYADLVISPDTAVLHASGCYETPKIGILGHTNTENITKYFINDYSIEAVCPCSPCFRLIYDHDIQCPTDPITRAAWCMAIGIPPEKLYERIVHVIGKHSRSTACIS